MSTGYSYVIEKLLQKFDSNSNMYPILNKIFEYISKRVKINIDKIEKQFGKLPEEMIGLINSYNKSLNDDISAALDEHTKYVTTERNRLSEENQRYIKELEELRKELLRIMALNEELQRENNGYREREETIKRVLSI